MHNFGGRQIKRTWEFYNWSRNFKLNKTRDKKNDNAAASHEEPELDVITFTNSNDRLIKLEKFDAFIEVKAR